MSFAQRNSVSRGSMDEPQVGVAAILPAVPYSSNGTLTLRPVLSARGDFFTAADISFSIYSILI
jgi:hypothetical protein